MHLGYFIMKPIQLPWMYVSPAGMRGLDYHLSPDVYIRLEGIITGDQEFNIGHTVLGIEGLEVNELQAESIFVNEYLPAKSKERVIRAFKDEQSSCFFTTRQMEHLQALFEQHNFMSYSVTVYYRDRKVEDIPSLPRKEYKLVSQAFDDLNVAKQMDYKENREESEQRYEESYKKTAELEEMQIKKSLWAKVRNKGIKKKISMAIGSVAIGVTAVIAQHKLTERGGAISLIAALLIGTAGVFMELYGRNEANQLMRQLQFEGRTERMAF